MTLHEVNEAVSMVQAAADPDANIIFGSVVDERAGDEVKITVIATGFKQEPIRLMNPRHEAARPVQVQVPASAPFPAPRPASAPRPALTLGLPLQPGAAVQPAASRLVATPATARAAPPAPPARREPGGFKPMDEDQYDIPAFMRRGGTGVPE
jgi:cell division protein FtsZ